jgi:hypothetical protein
MAIAFLALPAEKQYATAQDMRKKTYAFISAVPNPVGVNQELLLHLGVKVSLTSTERCGAERALGKNRWCI